MSNSNFNPAGALLGAGGAIVSNAIGAVGGYFAQKSANKAQIQIAREQNAFNAEQADIQRKWQEEQYNKYESPQAMVNQYREAGINPYISNSGQIGSTDVGNGAMAQSAGVPSLGSSAPYISNSFGNIGSSVQQTAQTIAQIENLRADTRKKGSETAFTDESLNLLYEQINSQKIQNAISAINLDIKDKSKDNLVKGVLLDNALKAMQSEKYDSDIQLNNVLQMLHESNIKLNDEQVNKLKTEVNRINELLPEEKKLIQEEQKTERSKQSANYSTSSLNSQLSKESAKRIEDISMAIERKRIDNNSLNDVKSIMRSADGVAIVKALYPNVSDEQARKLADYVGSSLSISDLRDIHDFDDYQYNWRNGNKAGAAFMLTVRTFLGPLINLGAAAAKAY